MRDDPKWILTRAQYDMPKPLNDAAKLVDLQIENEALKAALTSALADKCAAEVKLENYMRALRNGDLNIE
jgi:invasion protein IalB